MKKLIGLAACAVVIFGASRLFLRRENRDFSLSSAEKRSLHDAPGDGCADDADPARCMAQGVRASAAAAAKTSAQEAAGQGGSDLDKFAGVFSISGCTTKWNKGDWSLWDRSNSPITQVLAFEAKDEGRDLVPGAVKIKIERPADDPKSLLIYAADASGTEMSGGRNQRYAASFRLIDQPTAKTHNVSMQDPHAGETAPNEDPQIYQEDTHFTDDNFNVDTAGSSQGAALKKTGSGWAVDQQIKNTQGTRTAATLFVHRANKDDDAVRNRLELSAADGGLTYTVREKGEWAAYKWDVTQTCRFQPASTQGPAPN